MTRKHAVDPSEEVPASRWDEVSEQPLEIVAVVRRVAEVDHGPALCGIDVFGATHLDGRFLHRRSLAHNRRDCLAHYASGVTQCVRKSESQAGYSSGGSGNASAPCAASAASNSSGLSPQLRGSPI